MEIVNHVVAQKGGCSEFCNSAEYRYAPGSVAVHCVAGLGRAPVLVAVALVEKGMDALDAIMFIRERRKGELGSLLWIGLIRYAPGAINVRQLKFLENYKPRTKRSKCACTVM